MSCFNYNLAYPKCVECNIKHIISGCFTPWRCFRQRSQKKKTRRKSNKLPSEGHFFCPFLCKAYWSSRHSNAIKRLLKIKVESVGFVPAVPERTTKIVCCRISFSGRQIDIFCVFKASRAATKWENKKIQAQKSVLWTWDRVVQWYKIKIIHE